MTGDVWTVEGPLRPEGEIVRIGHEAGPLKDAVLAAINHPYRPPRLRLVCVTGGCGHVLAKMALVPEGMLFLSVWRDRTRLGRPVEINGRLVASAEELDQALAGRDEEVAAFLRQIVAPEPETSWFGVMDLLDFDVTPGQAGHPTLMVRCEAHGDTLIDRREARSRFDAGHKLWKIPLDGGRLRYALVHNVA